MSISSWESLPSFDYVKIWNWTSAEAYKELLIQVLQLFYKDQML